MAKVTNVLSALATALATASCTTITDFPTEARVGVGEVANRIQCQLRDVVSYIAIAYPAFKEDWSAGFKLELEAERKVEGSVKPFIWTIPAATSLKLGAEAAGSRDAVRKVTTEYEFNLIDLDTLVCPAPSMPSQPAAGEGLFSPIADYVSDVYDRNVIGTEKKPSLSYEVTFTIEHSASAGPTIEIVNVSAGISVGGSRTDTDKMTATFVRNPPKVVRRGAVPDAASRQIQKNLEDLTTPTVKIVPADPL